MKLALFSISFLLYLSTIAQSLEEIDRITQGFIAADDVEIELFKAPSKQLQLDSIQLSSNYLQSEGISMRVLGFSIAALDKQDEILFQTKAWNHEVPSDFNEKLMNCSNCEKVLIQSITINWFTGTYTLKEQKTI